MISSIRKNIFRMEIPLPDNPLKSVNSYAILGREKGLLVDTGLNTDESYEVLISDLKEISADCVKWDYFITHFHADHSGLISRLLSKESNVYYKQRGWKGWKEILEYARRNGITEDIIQYCMKRYFNSSYGHDALNETVSLEDNEIIEYGGYRFRCINTPGHAVGHQCLYEADEKILISGDHLLGDITPGIQCWDETGDPLKIYLNSLDKIYPLEVSEVLPGHRRPFSHFKERVTEIKRHHEERLEETKNLLHLGPGNAFSIASMMTWGVDDISWDQFSPILKWFATGEAIAHLRYLERKGEIKEKTGDYEMAYMNLNS
ncbi:MAG: MBL fold metallo-hydrolase [Deltaproteobacteria bacterium]|nr:MBL fold metallo-hydrolase [Deltaproteobacteria bacterium]